MNYIEFQENNVGKHLMRESNDEMDNEIRRYMKIYSSHEGILDDLVDSEGVGYEFELEASGEDTLRDLVQRFVKVVSVDEEGKFDKTNSLQLQVSIVK